MIDGVEFDDFEEWLRLPFELSDDELVDSLLEVFAADPAREDVKRAIAETALTIRNQVRDASDPNRGMFAAWVLLEPGGQLLRLHSVAMGMLMPVAPGTSAPELVESLIEGVELHQPVELETLQTALGPAQTMRVRQSNRGARGLEVAEIVSVFWLPPDDDVAVLLATPPMSDLVEASETASALFQLAATARPLRDDRG